jgi:hypothetical protein
MKKVSKAQARRAAEMAKLKIENPEMYFQMVKMVLDHEIRMSKMAEAHAARELAQREKIYQGFLDELRVSIAEPRFGGSARP